MFCPSLCKVPQKDWCQTDRICLESPQIRTSYGEQIYLWVTGNKIKWITGRKYKLDRNNCVKSWVFLQNVDQNEISWDISLVLGILEKNITHSFSLVLNKIISTCIYLVKLNFKNPDVWSERNKMGKTCMFSCWYCCIFSEVRNRGSRAGLVGKRWHVSLGNVDLSVENSQWSNQKKMR